MQPPSVPPFISRYVFAVATDDTAQVSQLRRLTRLAKSQQASDASLLSELATLIVALPCGLPRSRDSLHALLHEFTHLRLRRCRSLRKALRILLFASRTERVSIDVPLRTLRILASPSGQFERAHRDLPGLLRLISTRCHRPDFFAKQRVDAALFAAVASIRNQPTGASSSPRLMLAEFETARLLLATRNGPKTRNGEQLLPLRGSCVQLPSGGTIYVTTNVEAGVCVLRASNLGTTDVWVTRIEVAAACPSEMQVLLPPPTMAQSLLRRQPSLVVRGGMLGSAGRVGEPWASIWVR